MPDSNKDNDWPHQGFHDANRSKNAASRSSQVNWNSTEYHYVTNIEIILKEGRGVLKQPGSSISVVRVDQIGTVYEYFYRQY